MLTIADFAYPMRGRTIQTIRRVLEALTVLLLPASDNAAQSRASVNRFRRKGATSQCRKLGNQGGRKLPKGHAKGPTFDPCLV